MTDATVATALNRLFSDIIERHFASLGVLPKKGGRKDEESYMEECIHDALFDDDQPVVPCGECERPKGCESTLRHWSAALDACYQYALGCGWPLEELEGLSVNRSARHPEDDLAVEYLLKHLNIIDPFGEINDDEWDSKVEFGRESAELMKKEKHHETILDFLSNEDLNDVTTEQVGGLLREHHELTSGRICSHEGRMWRFGDKYWELMLARWRIDLPIEMFMPLLTQGVSQSYLNTFSETYLPRMKRVTSRHGLKVTDSVPSAFPQNRGDFIS